MSFRKKNKEAKEAEDVKISRAKDSQRDKNKSAAEQATPSPQSQRRTEQVPGQQSGQESGQPEQAEQAEQDDEQPEEETPQAEDEDDQSADSADSTPVPDGTTAEIVQWVGDDKDRARRALDKEQTHQKPRPGLTRELKKVLE